MVYIHVPFCRSFCTYCDFYSELACKGSDRPMIEAYTKSLLDEIDRRREEIKATQGLKTLYLGGGTPSVLPLDVLERIVNGLKLGFVQEFTIEVNPDDIASLGAGYVKGLVDLGVNRVSMGVQSLDDGVLKAMNRRHNTAQALEALDILRSAEVENISVDLIFGGLGVSGENLKASLDALLKFKPEHFSAYQLSIESGSALAQKVREGSYTETPDDECAAQYNLMCRTLADAGYEHYEISNWARPGYRAVHNAAYWRRLPYVGLGPGAHSFDGKSVRSWNSADSPVKWTSSMEELNSVQSRIETIMLGLRTSEGIDSSLCSAPDILTLVSEGLLEICGNGYDRVRIPEDSFFVSDSVINRLI